MNLANRLLEDSRGVRRSYSMDSGTSDGEREEFWRARSRSSELSPLPRSSSSNPQSPVDDCLGQNLGPSQRRVSSLFLVIAFGIVALGAVVTSRSTVEHAAEQVNSLRQSHKSLEMQLLQREHDIFRLKRELTALEALKQQQLDRDLQSSAEGRKMRALAELNTVNEQVKKHETARGKLARRVQERNRRELVQKYGSGPHQVEVELFFPDGKLGPTKFVIEMAPVETMPHSVLTFLDMVSLNLLDGCSFILNALHVLKAAPLPYDGGSVSSKAKSFADAGLEGVAFREYDENFPHKQYTIGFAADGSPSFYINTEDNSEIHGGDPCFGKIIEGFDAIRRLETAPTRSGIFFIKRIGINHARILPSTA